MVRGTVPPSIKNYKQEKHSKNPLTNARAGRVFGRNSHQTCVVMRPCDEYCARFLCQRLLALVTCTSFSIDELDRIPQTTCVCDTTPAMPHIRGFFHEARSRNNARELRHRATSDVASRQMPRTTSS